MLQKNEQFSNLKQLADGIVAMFGESCEVAVHDLSNLRHSLIHIAGNVTGRQVGAPATDLLVKVLNKSPGDVEDLYNYSTTTEDGRSIKSSTVFLKNTVGNIYAAFCINLDTTELFNASQLLTKLIQTVNDTKQETRESFAQTADQTVAELFRQTLKEIGKQPVSMTPHERMDMVSRLQKKGVFQMKGSVNQIAELSGVTKFTIYNYLKNIGNSTTTKTSGVEDEKDYPN